MQVLELDDRIPPSASGLDMGAPLTEEQATLLETELHRRIAAEPRAHWVEVLRQAEVCAIEHLPAGRGVRPAAGAAQPDGRGDRRSRPRAGAAGGAGRQVPFARPSRLSPPPRRRGSTSEPPGTTHPFVGRGTTHPSGPGAPAQNGGPLLEGVKILDLGAYFAGPYSSRLLADLGADVIKLEPTQGDQLRGIDQCFFPAQAGKRSLAMDLKAPGVQGAVEALLEWADVVHHNLRPGAAERLGLAYDDIRHTHPEVVYLYAPGWGSGGPDMLRQSFAPMMSGYVGVTFEAAGRYNEPLPTPCNEDPGNGMLGAACILMGLLHRRRTAQGMYIENPQLNATMSHVAHIVRRAGGEVSGAGRLDTLQYGSGPFERLYRTADGWICLAALEEDEILALARVLGLDVSGLADRADVADLMAARIEERATATWLATFEAAGCPPSSPWDATRTRS